MANKCTVDESGRNAALQRGDFGYRRASQTSVHGYLLKSASHIANLSAVDSLSL